MAKMSTSSLNDIFLKSTCMTPPKNSGIRIGSDLTFMQK